MPALNLPSPVTIPPLDSPDSLLGNLTNDGFLRFLFGNGQGTRIISAGLPINIETFISNLNRFGVTNNNRFMVMIDGPGFKNALASPVILSITGTPAIAPVLVAPVLVANANSSNAHERLAILCNEASFPEVALSTNKLTTTPSMQESIAQYLDFAENSTFELKFINTSSMFERSYFEAWMNTVANPQTGIANYYDEYAKPFSISVLKLPRNAESPAIQFNQKFDGLYGEKFTRLVNGQDSAGIKNVLAGIIYGVKYMECYPTKVSSLELSNQATAITETTVTFAYKYFRSPANVPFLDDSGSVLDQNYSSHLQNLLDIINNKQGKISYDPIQNSWDRLANTVNGVVNAATNVSARIQQIF